MRFDARTDDDDNAKAPLTSFGPSFGMEPGKWRCGAVAPNGKLYCVPHGSSRFLCVDPETLEVKEVGEPLLDEGGSKFFGAVTAEIDGKLYCCPYSASHVYRFDPKTGVAEKVGADLGKMEKKFSGGCMGPDGDTIYFVPNNAQRVYSFNVRTCQGAYVGPDLNAICGIEKSKFNGGVLGKDGALYLIPRDAPRVVRFDPKTLLAEPIGPEWTGDNKWAGGRLGADGHIYCAPHNHTHVLRIRINYVSRVSAAECKLPEATPASAKTAQENATHLAELEAALEQAVDAQEYAQAGELQSQIRKLKSATIEAAAAEALPTPPSSVIVAPVPRDPARCALC
jgi:hypothetical protein